MKIKLRCFFISLAALSLVGCGLKGPLYMPEKKTQIESSTEQAPKAVETQE